MNARDLLLHQTHLAFDRDDEMSLKASLNGVTDEMAKCEPEHLKTSISEIAWHLAWCKLWYCQQAFGINVKLDEPPGYAAKVRRLHDAQAQLIKCLEDCTTQQLESPVKTQFHSESGAHLFTVLAIHDVSHGASIRARKRLYKAIVS